MGDLRPDDGGGKPPDDGDGSYPGDLPEIPPDWGAVIIPDDASELDDEADEVRRELYRGSPRPRLRSALRTTATGTEARPITAEESPDAEPTSLGIPVVIMAVAIVTTLISLFVVTWGRPAGLPLPDAVNTNAASDPDRRIAAMVLPDATGGGVRIGALLPSVLIIADECECPTLVLDLARAAPNGVTIVAVGRTAPDLTPGGSIGPPSNVRSLADPQGLLRSPYATAIGGDQGVASAVLVNGSGSVVRHIARVVNVDDVLPLDGL